MKAIARARTLGGSLVVTVPKEIVDEEGFHAGDLIEIEVGRPKKSYFGAARGIGHFKKEDKFDFHG